MTANYCPECGSDLDSTPKFCPECGHEIETRNAEQPPEAESAAASAREESSKGHTVTSAGDSGASGDDTMFRATTGLIGGYFGLLIIGALASSNALIGLGVICLLVSLITMYVDLRDLEKPLWGTRPILWIVGSILLYIIVAPLYIYKRQQVG